MLEYQIYKNIFPKGNTTNWSEENFLIKEVIPYHGHILLTISMVKKLLKHFMKTNYKKTNQQRFRIDKVIKRKRYKLYVKWKGYDNSFNDWIDKNDFV